MTGPGMLDGTLLDGGTGAGAGGAVGDSGAVVGGRGALRTASFSSGVARRISSVTR